MEKETGQGLVEYALILLLVALAIIVILSIFGSALADTYGGIYSNIVNIP